MNLDELQYLKLLFKLSFLSSIKQIEKSKKKGPNRTYTSNIRLS